MNKRRCSQWYEKITENVTDFERKSKKRGKTVKRTKEKSSRRCLRWEYTYTKQANGSHHLYITRVPNFHIRDHTGSKILSEMKREEETKVVFLVQPKKRPQLKAQNQCLAKPKIKLGLFTIFFKFNLVILFFKYSISSFNLFIMFNLIILFLKDSLRF